MNDHLAAVASVLQSAVALAGAWRHGTDDDRIACTVRVYERTLGEGGLVPQHDDDRLAATMRALAVVRTSVEEVDARRILDRMPLTNPERNARYRDWAKADDARRAAVDAYKETLP